jgi:hypothetical protein
VPAVYDHWRRVRGIRPIARSAAFRKCVATTPGSSI